MKDVQFRVVINLLFKFDQSAGAIEYTDYRRVRPTHLEYPGYGTKQSDGEVLIMLELWEMWSTPSLSSLSSPHWLGVVTPDRVLSMGQIKLNCVLMLNWIALNRTVFWHCNCILMLNWTVWNRTKLYTHAKLNCLK